MYLLNRFRSLARFFPASFVVAACAPSRPAPVSPPRPAPPVAATIVREASFEDSELAALGRGRLELVVRSTDRPTQALPQAQVLVFVTVRDTVRRLSDQQGIVRFDSLPVGNHEIVVRRVGYGVARALVPIKPGCRTDAEAYISITAVGIDPSPPMPGRVTVTTCR